jgi:pimeloyl-ACP methyl ester carboxylesterase
VSKILEMEGDLEKRTRLEKTMQEELGLEELFFKVYRKKNSQPLDNRTSSQTSTVQSIGDFFKKGESEKTPNTYLLLHGWTGDHSIFEEEVMKKIFDKDPTAVIICPDGDGFGKSKFRSDINPIDLLKKCGPDGYAAQMDFLLKDVLELSVEERKNINIYGHSLGGAAAMIMAGQGYGKKIVAVCPAAFSRKSKAPLEVEYGDFMDQEVINYIKNKGHVNFETPIGSAPNVPRTYRMLAMLLGISAMSDAALKKFPLLHALPKNLTHITFDKVLADHLMGTKDFDVFHAARMNNIMGRQKLAHGREINANLRLASFVMFQLSRGIDLELDTEEGKIRAANIANKVTIISADNDKLGAVYLSRDPTQLKNMAPDPRGEALISQIEAAAGSNRFVDIRTVRGGHYAPVYYQESIDALLENLHKIKPARTH